MVDCLQESADTEVACQEERPFVQSGSVATKVGNPSQVGRFGHGEEKDGAEQDARDGVPEACLVRRKAKEGGAEGLQA